MRAAYFLDVAKANRARVLAGLTSRAIAKKLKVDASLVSSYFRGEAGGPKTMKRIADLLKVPLADILAERRDGRKAKS